jgi:hypothetical protein
MATSRAQTISISHPFRPTIVVVETLVGLGGLAGSIQLLAGAATPPVSVLTPLGLSSWTLPAGWLFITVAVPSGLAAWLAWRRSVWAPVAVLLASALLVTGLLVQIPFSGFQHLAIDLRHGCRRHGRSWTVGPQGRLVATPAYGRIDLTSLACACLDRALRLVKTSPNCPLFG